MTITEPITTPSRAKFPSRKQKTLRQSVSFSGIGIHTGQVVNMRFCPAKEGTGIAFRRVDQPGKPLIPATVEYVFDTSRSTNIGIKNLKIYTIEHVLAALKAYSIDNLIVELDNIEPPVGNGSSDIFVEMIESSGIEEQEQTLPIVQLDRPLYWSEKEIHLVALPYDGYKISYTLDYPQTKALKSQYISLDITPSIFKKEIAPCRTFSLYEEISHLMEKGLIKGGSLDNAVVIKEEAIFSKNGLYFQNEMARHKMLDMIGDLSLIGYDFHAHIISIKSGHPSNFAFAKQILNYINMENH